MSGDKLCYQSWDILKRKAQQNIKTAISFDLSYHSAVKKLANFVEFKEKQAKNQVLKQLCKSIYQAESQRKLHLANLEKIAKSILRSNFKTLEENKILKRQNIVSQLIRKLQKNQVNKQNQAYKKLKSINSNECALSHLANFLSQLHKRKNFELLNQANNKIKSVYDKEKMTQARVNQLLERIAALFNKAKKKAFRDTLKSVYRDKMRDICMEKMVNNFQGFLNYVDTNQGYDSLKNNTLIAKRAVNKQNNVVGQLITC